jgi:hypothetical protein
VPQNQLSIENRKGFKLVAIAKMAEPKETRPEIAGSWPIGAIRPEDLGDGDAPCFIGP